MFSKNKQHAIELFIEYTSKDSEDQFIEYKDTEPVQERTVLSVGDVNAIVKEYLLSEGLALSHLKNRACINQRNKLIRDLRACSDLSIRELAGIHDLNRNVI